MIDDNKVYYLMNVLENDLPRHDEGYAVKRTLEKCTGDPVPASGVEQILLPWDAKLDSQFITISGRESLTWLSVEDNISRYLSYLPNGNNKIALIQAPASLNNSGKGLPRYVITFTVYNREDIKNKSKTD